MLLACGAVVSVDADQRFSSHEEVPQRVGFLSAARKRGGRHDPRVHWVEPTRLLYSYKDWYEDVRD